MKRIFPEVKFRPQTPSIDKRDRRRCNSRGTPSRPPPTSTISQWACSLEWRQAVTLQILVGKTCITFFPFSCEACSLCLVLWLCGIDAYVPGWQSSDGMGVITQPADAVEHWFGISFLKFHVAIWEGNRGPMLLWMKGWLVLCTEW